MYKIEHFDLLYECVSADMITDMRFLDVWVEIDYVLDKMSLEKYLYEVKYTPSYEGALDMPAISCYIMING